VVSHKYRAGQNNSFRPTRMSALAVPQHWKIVRLLPIEDGSYLYRIKCVGENVERVVKEGYLGRPTTHAIARRGPRWERTQMLQVLGHFMSPPAVERTEFWLPSRRRCSRSPSSSR
jgi:hypothetical protein